MFQKKIPKTFDRNKIMLQKVAGVYIQASRIQTTGTKRLKGLRINQNQLPLLIHDVYTFFSNLRGLQFLTIGQL